MKELIALLWAIYGHAKNCHYKAKGSSFFGQHLLADRVIDNIDSIEDYVDDIYEVIYLGKEIEAPLYQEIFSEAALLIPERSEETSINFKNLFYLFNKTLMHIEILNEDTNLSVGDKNLLGNIAQDLQQSHGLLWRQTLGGENEEE